MNNQNSFNQNPNQVFVPTQTPNNTQTSFTPPPLDPPVPPPPTPPIYPTGSTEIRCPNCMASVSPSEQFCKECGAPLKKNCSACGAILNIHQTFCPNCGHPSSSSTTNPAIAQFNNDVMKKKNKKKALPFIIIGAVLIIIIGIVVAVILSNRFSFKESFSDIVGEDWCYIPDDDSYMEIDTNPYNKKNADDDDIWYEVEKINKKLGFSESVFDDMLKTSYNDGTQTAENDEFKARWTYHPDYGLEVKYTQK